MIGHLKKGKTGRYTQTNSSVLIQWTLLVLLSQGKGLTLEMQIFHTVLFKRDECLSKSYV